MSAPALNRWVGRLALHAWLLLAAAVVLGPFLWIVSSAFKRGIDIVMSRVFFAPVLSNFDNVLFGKGSQFLLNIQNSLIVGVGSTVLVVIVGALASYGLFRLSWPRWVTPALMLWAVLFHMIPPIVIVTAWFSIFRAVGLFDTYLGVILGHMTINLPLALWFISAFLRDVPKELEDAAMVDGCTHFGVFFRIVLPVMAPGLGAVTILMFIYSWDELVVALNLTYTSTRTVPVTIASFAQLWDMNYGGMAASSVLSILPPVVLVLVSQRWIVKGLTAGAFR